VSTPTVSVIIPAYNAEAFIGDTIQSALDQTYRDLEIIVVDDGSSDGTVARVSAFGDAVRLHQQRNGGVARARNTGVSLARGEWIAFLDSDDLWLPTKIEQQLSLANAVMTFTDRYNIGDRGDLPEIQSVCQPMEGGDIFEALLCGNFVTTTSVMMRRALFEQYGGFNVAFNGTEDWDLWLRVAADHDIGFCAQPLVRYRLHRGGISRNFARMNRERLQVISRALASPRGQTLGAWTVRRVWAHTWATNGFDSRRGGARRDAFVDYVRAAVAWPLELQFYKEAVKVCLNA
jgi:glycosyltransferase involved in cell wall biosynthesis